MPTDILVATPDQAFGEWLRDSLGSHGNYSARLVQTGGDVLASAAAIPCALAILDADLKGEPFVPLARSLQAMLPKMKLLVIPPGNDPRHPALTGLKPDGYLQRPFYFPDFLEMLSSLLSASDSRPAESDFTPLMVARADSRGTGTWMEDQDRAEAQLARLLLETNAQAALLAAEGKAWASAGSLGVPAARELAARLAGCFEPGERLDIARYIRLEATGGDHLLYATALLDELAVGLLYPAGAPLSQARVQAAAVTRGLLRELAGEEPPDAQSFTVLPPFEPDPEDLIPEEEPHIDLSVLLAGMPSPDPGGKPLFPPIEEPEESGDAPVSVDAIVFPWEQIVEQAEASDPKATAQEYAQAWNARIESWTGEEEPPGASTGLEMEDANQATRAITPRLPGETQRVSGGNGRAKTISLQSDTVPLPGDAQAETVVIPRLSLPMDTLKNPASTLINDQIYTFLLLPANPEHLLTDEYAEQLSRWLPNLCQAFGWRLNSVTLRPGYLQLMVRLAPAVSPSTVVRVLRQRTSERIFNRFPEYKPDEATTDFWAGEHLVASGPQPPSIQAVREFIQRTRRRQGYPGLLS